MVFRRKGLLLGVLGFLASLDASAAPLEVVPDEYIVEFRDNPSALAAAQLPGAARDSVANARRIGPRTKLINRRSGAPRRSGLSVSAARPFDTTDSFCAELPKHLIRACSPNFIVRASRTPNDPRLTELWGLGALSGVNAPDAWEITTGSPDVVVAVVDTGVDYTHPDLAPNMWRNPGEVPSNGLDDDGNGYIDDIHGIDAINESGNPRDQNGHGTHVAGTIAGAGDNALGVAGINWRSSVMGLRFLDADGGGTLGDAIETLNYLIDQKERGVNVRVVNASWGGGGYSEPFMGVLRRLHELGILFIAAAGNESNDNDGNPSYPAGYELPNVVSVGALTENQNLADFSNFGAVSVDLAAPGDGILSTVPGGYAVFSGTSMATPHVAGAVALLLAAEPSLSIDQITTRLFDSAIPLPALHGVIRTGRALNVSRLIRNDTAPFEPPPVADLMCRYDIVPTRYGRDKSADSAPLIHQGDELGFVTLSVPFEFPFHREKFSAVTVSPNGVVYMGSGPGDSVFDFEPGPTAPRRSIAAFHADLIAAGRNGGIRAAVGSDRVTVRWVSNIYGWRDGEAEVTLTLFADGTIRDTIEFSDPTVEMVAQMGATIGLAGVIAESAFTYSTGGSTIRDGLELTFFPDCAGITHTPRVTALRLHSERGRGAKSIKAGGRFIVDIRADRPTKGVELGLLINGKACTSGIKRVQIPAGTIRLRGSTEALEGRYGVRRLGVYSGTIVAQKNLSHSHLAAKARRKIGRFSAPRACRAVTRSLRSIR